MTATKRRPTSEGTEATEAGTAPAKHNPAGSPKDAPTRAGLFGRLRGLPLPSRPSSVFEARQERDA